MSILKVAKMFEKKLALANDKLVEDLRKVMGLASALSTEFDIYDDAYDASQQLAAKAYRIWNMAKNPPNVIPASVFSLHLDEMKSAAARLAAGATPKAQARLAALNNALATVTPTDVSPKPAAPKSEEGAGVAYPAKPGADPEKLKEVVRGLAPKPLPWGPEAQGREDSPFLRAPEGKGAPADKLNEVVKGLAPKPLPWSEEAQEPWKQ